MTKQTTRREVLATLAAGAAAFGPARALAQRQMPMRAIPSTGEMLPIIGLGSSKIVEEIAAKGTEPVSAVLRALLAGGGKLIDTWPNRDTANDAKFGAIISQPDFRGKLFVTTKVDEAGKEAGLKQLRDALQNYRLDAFDLAQLMNMVDLDTHWPTLKEWKAQGRTRYIGVTVAQYGLYDQLASFIEREKPDFIQINYSITERLAEERLLPLAADNGVAVIINRPFMNGAYFKRLANEPLPPWASEFGCDSWSHFSLQYILANPHLTVVLTETSNPAHMEENTQAAFGESPSESARAKMREFIDGLKLV